MRTKFMAIIYGFVLFILPLALQLSDASAEEELLPGTLKPSMAHLLSMVGDNAGTSPDVTLIGSLIDFVSGPKDMSRTYSMGLKNSAVSNYYEFTLEQSFERVMDLVYHPDIPSYITNPSSVRHSRWLEVNGRQQPFPQISRAWTDLTQPMIIKGLEFVENTPDTFSGAYYAYDQDRTLILMKHHGRRVLISISRQRDKSTVGKKGLVLGKDDDWNYLYTGEKGCTRTGLGWVDSYMYEAESIFVYYETDTPEPQVKCGVFKWLHAGWAGINMVQPFNIRDGIQRFVKSFKTVIEAPALKDQDQLISAFRSVERLPTEALRQKARDHFMLLQSKYGDSNKRNRKWFKRIFKDDGYFQGLQREELQALINTAYIKFLLGKDQGLDISSLVSAKRPG